MVILRSHETGFLYIIIIIIIELFTRIKHTSKFVIQRQTSAVCCLNIHKCDYCHYLIA